LPPRHGRRRERGRAHRLGPIPRAWRRAVERALSSVHPPGVAPSRRHAAAREQARQQLSMVFHRFQSILPP
jgi:hypothetical protein